MATENISESLLSNQAKEFLSLPLENEEQKMLFERQLWKNIRKSACFDKVHTPLVVLNSSDSGIIIGVPDYLHSLTTNYPDYQLQQGLKRIVEELAGRFLKNFQDADKLCQERGKYFAQLEIAEAKELEIKQMIQKQKDEGRCDIIPFPKAVAKRTISADATIAALKLFTGSGFKGNCRIVETTITNPQTNEKSRMRIKIGSKTNKCGVLKQSHHRALHIAWQQWAKREHKLAQEEGLHMGVVEMSMYKWTKMLCGSTGGSNYTYAMSVLEQMAAIRVEIAEASESGVVKTCSFSLISFSWTDKSKSENGQWTTPGKNTRIRILMSEYITENFLRKRLRPMSLKTYLEIKDPGRKGIAPLLFDWLEYQLSSRELYSKKLSKFPEDFGTTIYAKKSDRKKTILPTVNQLNGLLILEGNFSLKVWIEETTDGDDYKLMAQRIPVVH